MNREEIEQKILRLESMKTGDMMRDMEIMDELHNLKMELNGVKPMDSSVDCIGCGA